MSLILFAKTIDVLKTKLNVTNIILNICFRLTCYYNVVEKQSFAKYVKL